MMISDAAIIRSFIHTTIQGEEILLSNSNLKALSCDGINQLISNAKGLLASVRLDKGLLQFMVRPISPYYQAIKTVLQNLNFIHYYFLIFDISIHH